MTQTTPELPTQGDLEAAIYGHRWTGKSHALFDLDEHGWHLTPQAAQSLALAVRKVLWPCARHDLQTGIPDKTGG